MSRKKTHEPKPITTEADAWDLGYAEDAWYLNECGQYLPENAVHIAVRHNPALVDAFKAGSWAHTNDDQAGGFNGPRTPNPHKEVKS